jgi:predicted permease
MEHILQVTFPFFGVVLVGYVVARVRLLPLESIPGLNTFVLFFALPCMLYRFAAGTPIVRLLDPGVCATYVVCALVMVAFTIATTRGGRIGWNDASFGALVAAFPNSGFMGVPLLVALLGQQAAAPAIVGLAIDMILTSSLCLALSRLDGAGRHGVKAAIAASLRRMAVNPLPWAIALGCVATATGFRLWSPAMRTIEMVADGASPVALFTIGAVLARARMAAAPADQPEARRPRFGDVPRVVLYKLVLHPALVFGIGKLVQRAGVPLSDFSLTVLALVAALPSASNVPMLAERFGANTARVASIVLLTTAGAFVTFSAAVALLV